MSRNDIRLQRTSGTRRLGELVNTLTAFVVTKWGTGSEAPDPGTDRETGDIDEAHVVSSLIKGTTLTPEEVGTVADFFDAKSLGGRHQVVLDIDHPAWLVESTTPGHSHLYVELPGGVDWAAYEAFLEAAVGIGLLEPGYVEVSKKRGHTDVRLPWISKHDVQAARAEAKIDGPVDLPGMWDKSDLSGGRADVSNNVVVQQHNQAISAQQPVQPF